MFRSLFFLSLVSLAACRPDINRPDVPPDMREAYRSAAQLFTAAWDGEAFADPAKKDEISARLARLIGDFHRIESKGTMPAFEPGFAVSLREHREMLVDIRNRFNEGDTAYAASRLKGLAPSCVSCHSRYVAPAQFLGNAPPRGETTEDRLALAEYLYASGALEEAGGELLPIDDFRAMQLWLVIQTRLNAPLLETAEELDEWSRRAKLTGEEKRSVSGWITELKELENRPAETTDELTQAQGLLNPVQSSPSAEKDNLHLAKTLRAAAIVENLLLEMPLSDRRRKAGYLRAIAYLHSPLRNFGVLRDMYLEQCVREFPNSVEARRAFDILEDLVENAKSSSAELVIGPDQLKKLKDLRSLAYGRKVVGHNNG